MKRIDVLKGIEQILVQKAYETGHISHRADGDWQKQADGSWIPYKGQSSQSAPQTQGNSPTTNNKGGGIVKQDFESVPKSIKDKMFTIAQQYQSEWAEDSDEDVRSMAENDVEDISQMLWDSADEETRNSWIGSEDSNVPTVDLYSDDQIGFSSYANNINIDNGVADNDDLEDVANQILIDNDLEITDENMNKARDAMLSWLDANGYLDSDEEDANVLTKKGYEDFGFSEPRTKKQARKLIEDIADRLEQEYPNINDMLKNREHIDGDFQREQEETVNDVMEELGLKNLTDGDYYTRDAVESLYAKIHGHWYDEENSPQSDNADNNHEKYNIDGNVRQKIKDLAYKYNAIYDNGDFDTEQTEDIMREVGLDPTDDSQLDAFSDVMYDIGHGIEKSAVRDMRSAPTTKNMGF